MRAEKRENVDYENSPEYRREYYKWKIYYRQKYQRWRGIFGADLGHYLFWAFVIWSSWRNKIRDRFTDL